MPYTEANAYPCKTMYLVQLCDGSTMYILGDDLLGQLEGQLAVGSRPEGVPDERSESGMAVAVGSRQ